MIAESSAPDPFAEFDRFHGAERVRDPYPVLAAMRREAPVHRVDLRDDPEAPAVAGLGKTFYVVVGYEAVSRVLRDADAFSSRGYEATMGPVMGHTILEMDPPEHGPRRGLLQRAFSRGALERWEKELIRPVIERRVDGFASRGHADLVAELTFPFPVSVIAGMIGLAEEDHAAFHRGAVELISVGLDPVRARAASSRLRALFGRSLDARRREPRNDLLSVLAHAELDGARLGDEEIFGFLLLLAPAGAETTYRSSSNLLFGLLTHPDQLEAVRARRLLVPRAIEEGLRWECPLLQIVRTATRATRIGEVEIPEGATLSVNLGSANRDETRYPDPDAFDVFREPRPHLAFGFGPHRCLGMHLARMETRIVLEILFDRLPNLRLDPDAPPPFVGGIVFRSPRALPVRFAPL